MGPRPWTPEEDAQLRQMAADGLLAREVAKRLNRTTNSVRMHMRRLGETWAGVAFEDRRKAGGAVSGKAASAKREVRKARAIELWHQGMSRPDIAKALGVNISAANSYCRGLIRPKAPKPPKPKRAASAPRKKPLSTKPKQYVLIADAVRSYHEAGLSQVQTAAKLGVDAKTVRKAARFIGIAQWETFQPRQPKEPKPRRINYSTAGKPVVAKAEISTIVAAAQFLGRWYRPVYRATIANPKAPKDHYVVGRNVLPAEDMFALAREKGFAA